MLLIGFKDGLENHGSGLHPDRRALFSGILDARTALVAGICADDFLQSSRFREDERWMDDVLLPLIIYSYIKIN